jgi:methionyl-tRNA formyltransferase
MEKEYKAKDLINLLRARTFPPHPSAYFIDDQGRKVYVRVNLEYAEDDKNETHAKGKD